MARVDSFLRVVADQQASDLHLHAGKVPTIRYNGDLLRLPFRTLSETEARRFILELLSPAQREAFERGKQVDFMYVLPDVGRFRGSAFVQNDGPGAVLRYVPARIPTLEDLDFPPAVEKLTRLGSGLVLVTGPTGSGKTTTLAAIIQEIGKSSNRHIITIEDPIEYIHQSARSIVTQREVGAHTESFAAGLRAALREAPHVVVVGELRDLETVQLALSAAETGLLVFGTLHTNSAAKAVNRIVDMVPEEGREEVLSLLSVVLKAVIAQHLCIRSSGDGRVGALEILFQTHAVSHLIRENKIHQIEAMLQSPAPDSSGAQSLDGSLLRLVERGTVTLEEALRGANYPEQLRRQAASLLEAEAS
jgi:twitching motility protein PilT